MLDSIQVLVTVDLDSDLGYVWTCWAPVTESETLHNHAESEHKAIRRMLCSNNSDYARVPDDPDFYAELFNDMRRRIRSRANPGDVYWTRYISREDYKCDCYFCDATRYFKMPKDIIDELDSLEFLYVDLIYNLYPDSGYQLCGNLKGWLKLHYDDMESTNNDNETYLPVFDTTLIGESGLRKFMAHMEYYYDPLVVMAFLVKHGHNPRNYIKLTR